MQTCAMCTMCSGLTSFSLSTDLVKFMSSFHVQDSFPIAIQPMFTIFGPSIEYGGYMSVKHMSPDHDLIFMSTDLVKFMSRFHDQVSFAIFIQPSFSIVAIALCQNQLKFKMQLHVNEQFNISCFSLKFFFQLIYTYYANLPQFDKKKSHLNLLLRTY